MASSANSVAKIKGIFAIVVIALCLAYLVWRFWPSAQPYVAPPSDTYAKWESSWSEANKKHAEAKDATYWLLGKVSVAPTEDRSGAVVNGRVASQAELEVVKRLIESLEPKVPVTWNVSVGG